MNAIDRKTSLQSALTEADSTAPFRHFAPALPRTPLRDALTAACRRPEVDCLGPLIEAATLPAHTVKAAQATASALIAALRAKPRGWTTDALIQEFKLSSEEGVALMCLAEALLRIPDSATRDALIRDKIAGGNWAAHLSTKSSLFANAAAWGLLVTGKLTGAFGERALSQGLTRLVARGGEPLIRRGVEVAMWMMGVQFVRGRDIAEALRASRKMEAQGFRYSYDMLGEAAVNAADADRYYADYERALHAIGAAANGRGIYEGPGLSIKLSALHPRYARAQTDRVMAELLPRVKALLLIAKRYDLGVNIDAEESERLELSLDLMEALCLDPDLAGWNGIGFVVQAYGKRCPLAIDVLIDLARRSGHRLMVRLVKGAYWDSEIKRAQVEGQAEFPLYTRKVHTDVSYLACARKLLAAPDAVFPQFATHNAMTLALVHQMAGEPFSADRYEFQCLHGMGEPLYREAIARLKRPARIYAPVGTHETLLAYLVRRLLENGANSSFVNQIADPLVPIESLVTDPVAAAAAITPMGSPHPQIARPSDLYGPGRRNSAGIDLTSDGSLRALAETLAHDGQTLWRAAPILGCGEYDGRARDAINPANHRDVVGEIVKTPDTLVATATEAATRAAPGWALTPPALRAQILLRAADLIEARLAPLMSLVIREAGKSAANAVAEVREAVDFLRYYAAEVRDGFDTVRHEPLGLVVCISPWNFPMAIFTGQIAAALAAGNVVIAKPAEQTPLIAAETTRLLIEAGLPAGVLQLLPGDGHIGAALVADPAVHAVMFTGSTDVARHIQRQLAHRLNPDETPVPLIAETGGLNAMIVDSSALGEQVVADVLASAFDSAGQRCSALRILCLQEEIADRTIALLKGAMAELRIGNPDQLSIDIGPVIDDEAKQAIDAHIRVMRERGYPVFETARPDDDGTFVAPTLVEIEGVGDLSREVFGPVLHVVRYRRDELPGLIDAINDAGYGLTFGLHTRLDTTIEQVAGRIRAGNVYVNRNIIGATVGVQPFGGHGLSGTGPKAGGPLYLLRLLRRRPESGLGQGDTSSATAGGFRDWLKNTGHANLTGRSDHLFATSPLGARRTFVGPVGEDNGYTLLPRGTVVALPETECGLVTQIAAGLATGNRVIVDAPAALTASLDSLPPDLKDRVTISSDWVTLAHLGGVLVEGCAQRLLAIQARVAARPGAIVGVQGLTAQHLAAGEDYTLDWLVIEQSVSVNTTAAGGNASMTALA